MAGVVRLVLAAGAGHLAEVRGGSDRGLDLRVRTDPPADQDGEQGGEDGGGDPPVAGAVDGSGESGREEAGSVAPGGAAGAGDGGAGAGHELGEPGGEHGVRGARLDDREVGGRALVQGDEFVGLGAGELAAPAQEVLEALPLGAVGGDVDVEVHDRLLLQASAADGSVLLRRAAGQLGRLAFGGVGKGGEGWVP